MPAGIRGEQVDKLQVEQTHVAVNEAAVLVENAREAPSLHTSELRAGRSDVTGRGEMRWDWEGGGCLALAQARDEAARPVGALDAVHEEGAVVGSLMTMGRRK